MNSNEERKYGNLLTALILSLICIALRLFVTEAHLVDADTVSFALAAKSYSLADTRPHMPGYYFHVKIIELLAGLTGSERISMFYLSLFYSGSAALITYLLLFRWFGKKSAILVSILIMTNPMILYYGSVTEIYSFDWFFGALLVFVSYYKYGIFLLPSLLAFGTGIRQSSGVLLLPLYAFLIYDYIAGDRRKIPKILAVHLPAVIIVLIWFLPMVGNAGGLKAYFELFTTNSPVPRISFVQNLYQMSSYWIFILLPALLLIPLLLLRKSDDKAENLAGDKKMIMMLSSWLVLPLLTFISIHYSKGYFLLIALPFYSLFYLLVRNRKYADILVTGAIVFQLLVYFVLPYKIESPDTFLNHKNRKSGVMNTWLQRTQSAYLMGASRIRYENQVVEDLSELINYLQKGSVINSRSVFLDPSAAHFARGMEYLFPGTRFITMDQSVENGYIEFYGLTIKRRDGLKNEIKDCVIITRRDMLSEYIRCRYKPIFEKGQYALILPEDPGTYEFYNKMFLSD